MKLTQLFNRERPMLSFEVFPPKNNEAYENVKDSIQKIAQLNPDYMSVTYGAGGGTSVFTSQIAANIQNNFGVSSLAHLTCISSDKETVRSQLEILKENGVENILALRGDIKKGEEPDGSREFKFASDLIKEIKSFGDFCIGGACYPEIHPESVNQKEDILHLKEKVDAGCDFLTTQMFFDNNLFYNFLYKIREAGITVPVIAGIMPITGANQVARAIQLSGSFMPQRFKSLVDKFGNDPLAMTQAGIAYATDQIIDLYANGIKNVHVYTMNKPHIARKIQENLSDILGK